MRIMDHLDRHIEAILFVADKPIALQEIIDTLNNLEEEAFFESEQIKDILSKLQERYSDPRYAFSLVETGGGFQFLTKPDYHDTISLFLRQKSQKRLSTAAMETLAIIAYKQPVSKPEVEQIRGVNCDYTINKLLEKDLIHIAGRGDGPGRPVIYGLSDTFLDYFGINSIDELPKPKEVAPSEDNTIGDTAEEVAQ